MAHLKRSLSQRSFHVPTGRLQPLEGFGSNPGALHARTFIPADLPPGSPLVVVLHGCTQDAASYDHGSGWSEMAARHGFALLFPEQQRSNNPNLCFNWFSPADSRRDEGEALSIRQMVDAVQQAHQIDPARIFVTGLSAGGAMTSVMLATYPELFAGGAIIAGLPYGVAASVPQAFEQMRGGAGISAALAQKVRQASTHTGQWPTISVWHGSADATVSAENARSIIEQWRPLHGADAAPREATVVDGVPRRSWSDGQGREVIEEYIVAGMGHGTPLHPAGEGGCGTSGAYMLDVGISSTHHICRFWGLLAASDATRPNVQAASAVSKVEGARPTVPALAQRLVAEPVAARPGQVDVAKVIEDALRSAGLMR